MKKLLHVSKKYLPVAASLAIVGCASTVSDSGKSGFTNPSEGMNEKEAMLSWLSGKPGGTYDPSDINEVLKRQPTASGAAGPGNVPIGNGREVLLQGFHWNSSRVTGGHYNDIASKAGAISNLGVSIVWMPPPWNDWSSWGNGNSSWDGSGGGGEGYFWGTFDKNSRYGSEAEMDGALSALNNAGVRSIIDIVPNHINCTSGVKQPGIVLGNDYGYDPFMSGECDVNTGSSYQAFSGELQYLRTKPGVIGWRYDFVRGFPGGRIIGWNNDTDAEFCVGEKWKEDSLTAGSLAGWSSSAECATFDFALKNGINNYGIAAAPGALNASDQKYRAVTFIDNHDTGFSPGGGQHHWPYYGNKSIAYAYILTSPGTPTIYWSDAFDWGMYDELKSYVDKRKEAGVHANSRIDFYAADGANLAYTTHGDNGFIHGRLYNDGRVNLWVEPYASPEQETEPAPQDEPEGEPETSGMQRTVVFIKYQTSAGQDLFIRGGHDHSFSPKCDQISKAVDENPCAIRMSHNNTAKKDTLPTEYKWQVGDDHLDWYGLEPGQGDGAHGTPFMWTTNSGAGCTVDECGYGDDPENTWGPHYWKLDVMMDCAAANNGTFEVKYYVYDRNAGSGWWQSGSNFVAKCGQVNVFH